MDDAAGVHVPVPLAAAALGLAPADGVPAAPVGEPVVVLAPLAPDAVGVPAEPLVLAVVAAGVLAAALVPLVGDVAAAGVAAAAAPVVAAAVGAAGEDEQAVRKSAVAVPKTNSQWNGDFGALCMNLPRL